MPGDVSTPLDDTEMRFRLVAEEVFGPSLVAQVEVTGKTSDDVVPKRDAPIVTVSEGTVIDLDADPFVPKDLSVEQHKKGGMLDFDPAKIALYLSEGQKGDKLIKGNKLREELEAQPVPNANMLDFLLKPENRHLIPESWKGKAVFFWGTIYREHGRRCVRLLCWHNGGWEWGVSWLADDWGSDDPAAVSAS